MLKYFFFFNFPDDKSETTETVNGEERTTRTVYEALIEDKGKNVIYLRLSASMVQMLLLKVSSLIGLSFIFEFILIFKNFKQ